MTDPFAILGVPRRFRLDLPALEQRHRDLSRALHPDRHTQGAPAERRMAIEKAAAVNDAFRLLRNPQTRAAALLASAGRVVEEHSRAEPELLLEIMELREELEATRESSPEARASAIAKLRNHVQAKVDVEERCISDAFDHSDTTPAGPELERAYAALVKLRYLYRFVEEADAMSEIE